MRRVLIAIAGVVIVVIGGGVALLTWPPLAEKSIEWTCGQVTPRCIVRMRAMGHVWSQKDDLARAKRWYELAAVAGDPAAMFHLAWIYEEAGRADLKATISSIAAHRRAASAGGPVGGEPTMSYGNFFKSGGLVPQGGRQRIRAGHE